MKFKKIISAAIGAAMLCASLPIGAVVNLTDNTLKANAVEEPYSESEYPSESYYYGSGEATWEEASEGYSSEEYETEAPSDYPYWWGETTEPYEEDPSYHETTEPCTEAEETTERTELTTSENDVFGEANDANFFNHDKIDSTVVEVCRARIPDYYAGRTIWIPVKIFNSTGFSNTDIDYTFDKNLKLISVYGTDFQGQYGYIYGTIISNPSVNTTDNIVSVSSNQTAENINDGQGYLYYLEFKLPSDMSSGDTFDISANIKQFTDNNGNDIDIKTIDGGVTVCNSDWSEKVANPESVDYLSGDNAALNVQGMRILKGDAGKILRIPVVISPNVEFANTNIRYNFDEKLKFFNIERNLAWSPALSFGDNSITISSEEKFDIKTNYSYNSTTLYYLNFELPDTLSVGETFNISAELLEFTNSAGENINPKVFNAKITVLDDEVLKPTNVTYNHLNDKETVIEVGNVKISKEDAGKIIEVPVSIFNNSGFYGAAIRYDFEQIESLGIEDGLVKEASTAKGNKCIAVVHTGGTYDNEKNNVEITSNGILYYLKLRLPEDAKTGDVFNISISTVEKLTFEVWNGNGEDIDVKPYGGSISIIDDTSSSTEPTTEEPSETETSTSSENNLYGDVNVDDDITIADAVLLNKYLVNSASLSDQGKINADAFFDGKITSDDTLAILKLIVGTYDSLPVNP